MSESGLQKITMTLDLASETSFTTSNGIIGKVVTIDYSVNGSTTCSVVAPDDSGVDGLEGLFANPNTMSGSDTLGSSSINSNWIYAPNGLTFTFSNITIPSGSTGAVTLTVYVAPNG